MRGKDFMGFLQLFLVLITIVQGRYRAKKEEVKPGKCPAYPFHANFLTSRFEGTWYIAHQFQTNYRFLRCQELNFSPIAKREGLLKIEGSVRATPSMILETDGQSRTPNISNPAYMTWTWDYFPSLIDHVTVLDTDYDSYAVIILCHDYLLFHTVYPILMTREKPINSTEEYETYIARAEKIIPFPVTSRWERPQICTFSRYFTDTEVKTLDIDKTIKDLNTFVSSFD